MRAIDPIGTNEALVGSAEIVVSHDGKDVTIVPGGDEIEIVLLVSAEVVLVAENVDVALITTLDVEAATELDAGGFVGTTTTVVVTFVALLEKLDCARAPSRRNERSNSFASDDDAMVLGPSCQYPRHLKDI